MPFLGRFRREVNGIIPAIIYFLITFNLLHFVAALARQPGDIRYYNTLGVSIFALVVGKVVLIVNCFSFINAFPNRPLIYNILWKLFVYNFAIFLFRIVDLLIHLGLKFRNIDEVFQHLYLQLSIPMFWATELGLVVVFFGYLLFSEFVRVLGKEKVMKILFG